MLLEIFLKKSVRNSSSNKNIKSYDFNEDLAREIYPKIYLKKVNQSKELGKKILSSLRGIHLLRFINKDVEFADFRVLKSVDIPSVLVESGFITNPDDAKRLKTKAGRRMIARSIFFGIHNY